MGLFLGFLVQFLVAFTIIVPASADELSDIPKLSPVEICEPGATFYEVCNICHCSNDGSRKFCTTEECGGWTTFWSKIKAPFSKGTKGCDPGYDYKVGCHICTCDEMEDIVCPEEPCHNFKIILDKFLKKKKYYPQ